MKTPQVDFPLAELERYAPAQTAPPDSDEVWRTTLLGREGQRAQKASKSGGSRCAIGPVVTEAAQWHVDEHGTSWERGQSAGMRTRASVVGDRQAQDFGLFRGLPRW